MKERFFLRSIQNFKNICDIGWVAGLETTEKEFKLLLLPRDPNDDKSAVVEIRAGTGGDEAGLFVGDIFRMYQKYADHCGWKLDVLNSNESIPGAFKEIIFSLEGENAHHTAFRHRFRPAKTRGRSKRASDVPSTI